MSRAGAPAVAGKRLIPLVGGIQKAPLRGQAA